jgi:hypothetical protein
MASGGDVLNFLIPNNRCVIYGNDYDSIIWNDTNKITKAEFEAGFAQYDAWKAEQDSAKAAQKAALLDRLGITEDEAKLLLA